MFYVTSTKYVGPNRDQNADTAVMEITNEAPRTNSSHEVRTEGWLGTTNDWSENAHGQFETLEAARAFVEEHMDGDYREEEVDSYEAEHGIVARFKYGAYEKMSAEASVGWLRDGDDGVTVDMTDEQIEALVQDCDQEMHQVDQGFQLDLDAVRTFLFDRRTELKEEAAEEFADERLVLEIDEDTTDEEIEAAIPFPDMQVVAKNHRTAGLSVYRQDETVVLWGEDFGWVNQISAGEGNSVFFDDASGVENPWAALQTYHKAA